MTRAIMALLTLTTAATLTSCTIGNSEGGPYDVTLYSGGPWCASGAE